MFIYKLNIPLEEQGTKSILLWNEQKMFQEDFERLCRLALNKTPEPDKLNVEEVLKILQSRYGFNRVEVLHECTLE